MIASTRKQTVRYQYDALGRRVSRLGKGVGATGKYTYDGQDVGNEGVVKYQNGLVIDDKLKLTSGGVSKYFLADHLGSTTALTDSSGNAVSSATYDSFGNSINNLTTRYQFTGREYDSFTGLHYYRARFYDAKLGRFTSEDPIRFAGGDVNLYGYVRNQPLSLRDPSGKIPPIAIGIVVGAIILGLTSPEYVNAPGLGNPVYRPENPIYLNGVMAMAGGYLLNKGIGAIGSKFCKLKPSNSGGQIASEGAEAGANYASQFSPDDFAYGPSAGGKLAEWAEANGLKRLNDLPKPPNMNWDDFTAQTMESVLNSNNKIHFDLTHMDDIAGTIAGTNKWGNGTTAFELRYLQANWSRFSNSVIFYVNGAIVKPPW